MFGKKYQVGQRVLVKNFLKTKEEPFWIDGEIHSQLSQFTYLVNRHGKLFSYHVRDIKSYVFQNKENNKTKEQNKPSDPIIEVPIVLDLNDTKTVSQSENVNESDKNGETEAPDSERSETSTNASTSSYSISTNENDSSDHSEIENYFKAYKKSK